MATAVVRWYSAEPTCRASSVAACAGFGRGGGPRRARAQRGLEHRARPAHAAACRPAGRAGAAAQRRQRAFAADRAQHVERDDVAGAFPDRAQVRVAHQPRVGPFLDVAAAAAHLHRVAGDLARIAAGAELDQRRQDAHQRVGRAASPASARSQRLGGLEHHRARLLGRQQQLEQLAAHQRHVDQAAAEGARVRARRTAPRCSARRISPAARTPLRQARVVDHVGHLLEAAAAPRRPARRARLRGGSRRWPSSACRACPSAARCGRRWRVPSGSVRGSRNSDTPFMPGRRAVDARQHHRQAGVGVGAEPLVAVQAPGHRRPARRASRCAATSEPAPCSVMNIAPWCSSSKSCVVSRGR